MRYKDIKGKYIGNVAGFCYFKKHMGALSKKDIYIRKCKAKSCKYFENFESKVKR